MWPYIIFTAPAFLSVYCHSVALSFDLSLTPSHDSCSCFYHALLSEQHIERDPVVLPCSLILTFRKTINAASTVSTSPDLRVFSPPLGDISRTHIPGSLGPMALYFLYCMELTLMWSINGYQELETWFCSLRGTSKRDSCQQWTIRREVGWQCEDLEKGSENLKRRVRLLREHMGNLNFNAC